MPQVSAARMNYFAFSAAWILSAYLEILSTSPSRFVEAPEEIFAATSSSAMPTAYARCCSAPNDELIALIAAAWIVADMLPS